jgi:hypothetical protein
MAVLIIVDGISGPQLDSGLSMTATSRTSPANLRKKPGRRDARFSFLKGGHFFFGQ